MRKLLFFLLIGMLLGACTDSETEKRIQQAVLTAYKNPPQIKSFEEVASLLKILSDNSELSFNEWGKLTYHDGSEMWGSSTAIQQFGKYSKNGFQNDIGIILIGKEKEFINEVQIVLNIKNPAEFQAALASLSVWSEQIVNKLNIEHPVDLSKSILNAQPYYYENELSYILLQKQRETDTNYNIHPKKELDKKVTYERWKLIIKSK